jgi:hypothetical protein
VRRLAAILAAILVATTSCAVGTDQPVRLALYMRNLSGEPYSYFLDGQEGNIWEGELPDEPASAGCGRVGVDWTLSVHAGAIADPEDAPAMARISGGEIGRPMVVAIWIEVGQAGDVQIGQGVPIWWMHDIQRCT